MASTESDKGEHDTSRMVARMLKNWELGSIREVFSPTIMPKRSANPANWPSGIAEKLCQLDQMGMSLGVLQKYLHQAIGKRRNVTKTGKGGAQYVVLADLDDALQHFGEYEKFASQKDDCDTKVEESSCDSIKHSDQGGDAGKDLKVRVTNDNQSLEPDRVIVSHIDSDPRLIDLGSLPQLPPDLSYDKQVELTGLQIEMLKAHEDRLVAKVEMAKSEYLQSFVREARLHLMFRRRLFEHHKSSSDVSESIPLRPQPVKEAMQGEVVSPADISIEPSASKLAMSPRSYLETPGHIMGSLFSIIQANWGLEDILDILPNTLNPYRAHHAMAWGVDLVMVLAILSNLTQGRHAQVVEGFRCRIKLRTSSNFMSRDPWVNVEDVRHLINRYEPPPPGVGPMGFEGHPAPPVNNPEAAIHRRLSSAGAHKVPDQVFMSNQTPSSQRSTQPVQEAQPKANSAPPTKVARARTKANPGNANVSGLASVTGRRSARLADKAEPQPLHAHAGVRKRSRPSEDDAPEDAHQQKRPRNVPQDGGAPADDDGPQQPAQDDVIQHLDQANQHANDMPAAAEARHVQNLGTQIVPPGARRNVIKPARRVANGLGLTMFENHYPMPPDATPKQRIELLRFLMKRNSDGRAAATNVRSDAINLQTDSRDAEYDYCVHLEQIKIDQEAARQREEQNQN
ncbi:hypothetical protein BKA63DRAFT_579889 [Paraphoma chrysanthemicola]|nr:hypothetical protein BKA63DRAFT_579889 [Paraphoma chrysanthemicola]